MNSDQDYRMEIVKMKKLLMIGCVFIVSPNFCMNNKFELWQATQDRNFVKWTNDYLNRSIDAQLTVEEKKFFEAIRKNKHTEREKQELINEQLINIALRKTISKSENKSRK